MVSLAQQGDAIEFEGVSFSYESGERALSDVSLRIAPGEFVAIVGANGSGKSTLAKHINALLVPDEGRVRTAGLDTRDAASVAEIRSRAGMVFQNPDNQSVASIVRDDVAFGPENLGLGPDEVSARVERALSAVGMGEHADDEVHALSGGQKQLVAIAGVLAMGPEIIVLDEPGAMLDVRGRAAVMGIVRELHAQGFTVVLVTHFMDDALEADRVIALSAGKVAVEGAPAEVFSDVERLRALSLEPPFAFSLAHDLRAAGVEVEEAPDEAGLRENLLELAASSGCLSQGAPAASPQCEEAMVSGEGPDMEASGAGGEGLGAGNAGRGRSGAPAASVSPETIVNFEQVSFSYGATGAAGAAVRELDFDLREGEMLGIVGHTGSGKSTATQLMNALLVPTAGRVAACGMDTAERKLRREVRRRVGLVFQYPETQLFATTVGEDVAFGPRNLGLSRDEARARAERALERVGLSSAQVGQRSPFSLSGGQQRRVAIAGVLAMEPSVLVLDEPAAGLDPRGVAEMRALLCNLNAGGTTVVLVSHSMEEVAATCDRVLVLDRGSRLALGSPAQVFSPQSAESLRDAGLGVPRAMRFAIELADGGLALRGPILTEGQLVGALRETFDRKA